MVIGRWVGWKTWPLWAMIVAGFVVLAVVLAAQLRLRGAATPSPPSALEGDVIVTGLRLSTLLNGQQDWDVSAARARLFDAAHRAVLDMVHGAVRMADGSWMRFEGDRAVVDTESHDFELEGGADEAVVMLPSGYVLRANTFRWNQHRGELVSDDQVSLSGPTVSVHGTGLLVRPFTQEFSILHGVRVDVVP